MGAARHLGRGHGPARAARADARLSRAGLPDREPMSTSDDVYFLIDELGRSGCRSCRPTLDNHGNHIVSLGDLPRGWPAGRAARRARRHRDAGADAARRGRPRRGVRTGDKGVNKQRRAQAELTSRGADCLAKAHRAVRGPARHARQAAREAARASTRGKQAAGLRDRREGAVGDARRAACRRAASSTPWTGRCRASTFGGGVHLRPVRHALVRRLRHRARRARTRPATRTATCSASRRIRWCRALLEGGKPVSYGAKAIPEGGWCAMPKLYADGLLLCGDTGGFLNGGRLKGIHLAIKSGMLAAETAVRVPARRRLLGGEAGRLRAARRRSRGPAPR